MMKKSILVLLVTMLGLSIANANMSKLVFYPKSDLSSATAHFYHQGDKQESYEFLFDKGFDKKQITYAQPGNYTIETQKDEKVKLRFGATDRYSYTQHIERNDFIVNSTETINKILICGGDCASSKECVIEQNILTVMVPKEQKVFNYKGLDDNLKELKIKEWKISEGNYTLIAPNVKGACIYMELESQSVKKEKVEAKSEMTDVKKSTIRTYDNQDLFVKGDVVLTILGKGQLKQLADTMKKGDKLLVRLFQDTVAPVRLVALYPTAQLFSTARAEEITKYLVSIEASRLEVKVIEDKLQKTRIETEIIPAR
ncbi:MAG: hypothetical protein V2A75_11010 [Pseudomonadota bacterium]